MPTDQTTCHLYYAFGSSRASAVKETTAWTFGSLGPLHAGSRSGRIQAGWPVGAWLQGGRGLGWARWFVKTSWRCWKAIFCHHHGPWRGHIGASQWQAMCVCIEMYSFVSPCLLATSEALFLRNFVFFCNLVCWNLFYDEYSLLLWWFLCSFLMAFACDLSSVLFWAPPFLNMGHTQRGTTSQIVNTHLVLELASTTPASTKAQMLMEDINRAGKHLRRLCLGFDKLRWISPHLCPISCHVELTMIMQYMHVYWCVYIFFGG